VNDFLQNPKGLKLVLGITAISTANLDLVMIVGAMCGTQNNVWCNKRPTATMFIVEAIDQTHGVRVSSLGSDLAAHDAGIAIVPF
jgi:hypothetical protein